ncbi:MAG: hypothetical protein K0S74_1209 [Chlamydiales bacterium]|jgi:hypothetical protein|nr:hypothetical protein [Chlamydiales bacterium]
MGDIIYFAKEEMDIATAIKEIDFMVTRYLESLESLKDQDVFEIIPSLIANITTYWNRLLQLLEIARGADAAQSIDNTLKESLQRELNVLQSMYLKVNQRICFLKTHWTDAMWKAADAVLDRMDQVLAQLGFAPTHRDRIFIRERQLEHTISQQQEILAKHKPKSLVATSNRTI